jgi:hypothetical protein
LVRLKPDTTSRPSHEVREHTKAVGAYLEAGHEKSSHKPERADGLVTMATKEKTKTLSFAIFEASRLPVTLSFVR